MSAARLSTLRSRGWTLIVLLAGVTLVGCYKPNIKDGGLKCNMDAGIAKACPEGFKCDLSTATCWQMPRDGGPVDKGTDLDVAEAGPDTPTTPCFDARPDCTPGPDMCDPFCQTGCGCNEKCSVNTSAMLTCKPLAPGQVRGLQQPCEVQGAGSGSQIDQCAPGLVCVEDACGTGGANGRCYQFCRADNECTDAPCNRDAGGGFKYCDVPFVGCSPLPPPNQGGCPGVLTCYLATSDVSQTLCDCQFPPGLREGDVCTRSRECNAGLVCVADALGAKVCTRVCRLTGTDCPVGTCRTLTENGKTNTTFGFCRL